MLQTGGPARLVLGRNSAMPLDKSVEQLPAPSDSSFSSQVKPVRESNGEIGESTDSSDSPMPNRHSKAATTLTNLSAHGMAAQIIDWSSHGISEKIGHIEESWPLSEL